MPKDAELYQRLDEVVHYIWDPIGISNFPDARTEYHSYLPEIYARVKVGKKEAILDYMEWVVCERMGMSFDKNSAGRAAEIMIQWKNKIIG